MKTVFVRKLKFVPAILLLAYTSCSEGKTAPAVASTIAANSSVTVSQIAGTAVSPAPSVIIRDQSGNPFAGAAVTFSVVSGGGAITGPSVVTDTSGIAAVGSWTLGKTAGVNVLTASSGSLTVTFNATGIVGQAALVTVSTGNNQTAVAGSVLPIPPAVLVQDANGNAKQDVTVTFAVGAGGGSVTGATATSNAAGVAAVGSWTLGKTAGANALTASSGNLTVTFNATGIVGPAALVTVSAGDNQTAVAGSVVPVPPAVLVRDANGNAKQGVTVTFAVGSGGGSLTGAVATSTSAGIATVGSWTLGPAAAGNTLVATTAGAPSVTFTAVAACAGGTTLTLGCAIGGTLAATDSRLPDGSFIDFYPIVLPEANAYLFNESASFDTYLNLSLSNGTVIAENDDASTTTSNSAIKALVPAGTYLVGAGSFGPGITGSYTVSAQVTPADNANCELVFTVRNVSTTQRIAPTDCLWPAPATPIYADAFYILLRAGESITVDMSSTDVDSYLEIVSRVSGLSVAQNDNRNATSKDAEIIFTAPVTDYYAVVARTAIASQTGAYTLTIK